MAQIIRRLILAAALIAGFSPAIAQVPPPIPALPDTIRQTSYSLTGSTCLCFVNFQLYGDGTDYQNWLQVWINGVQVQYNDPTSGWSISSATGQLGLIPRPISDAVLTFNSAQTGTVVIIGARRPRRTSQFTEGRGVTARDLNQILSDLTAQSRESWDFRARVVNTPVTNSQLAGAAAATIKGNPTSGPAAVQDFTIQSLVNNPAPDPNNDFQVFYNAATNTLQRCTVAACGTAGMSGVPTFNGAVGPAVAYYAPRGRLTLTSGTPVPQTSVAAATRVYYTSGGAGDLVPIYNGTNFLLVPFPEVFQDTTDTTKSPAAVAPSSCYDEYAWVDGATPRVTRGAVWPSVNPSPAVRMAMLTKVSGFYLNSTSITNGPASQRGLLVGTICSNSSGSIDFVFGSQMAGGGAAKFGVWNMFNRKLFRTTVTPSDVNWTYNVANTWRAPIGAIGSTTGSATMRVSAVRGFDVDDVQAQYHAVGVGSSGNALLNGIGVNSTTNYSGTAGFSGNTAQSQQLIGAYQGLIGLGQTYVSALEADTSTATATFVGAPTAFIQSGLHVGTMQ
jgi:hypothetical protein